MMKRLSLRDDLDPEIDGGVAPDEEALVAAFEAVLRELGEDPKREGLLKTPARVARALKYLTSGYEQDPAVVLNGALFTENYNEMVLVKDIDFFSMCEHHMLPFFGKAHVAYVPDGRIVGLSKLPRLVEVFSRRLQVQERLTKQIAESIWELLEPRGVGAGAHGKLTDAASGRIVRTTRPREPRRYLAQVEAQGVEEKPIAAADLPFEYMMNTLRRVGGCSRVEFESRTGLPWSTVRATLELAMRDGLVFADGDCWRTTPLGARFLNDLVGRFLP